MAHNPGHKIDAKKGVQDLFRAILDKAGATDELLALRVFEGLQAIETKIVTKDGSITETRNLVNFAERRAMTELALRVKGILVDKYQVDAGPTLAELLDGL